MNTSTLPSGSQPPRSRPALRLVNTLDLDREQWLEVRRRGIGSSDAAAAVGLNPYQSRLELWMDKTGRGDQLPRQAADDDSSPAYWGTLLEPIVAAHYTRRTGNPVRRVNAVLQHRDRPWMLANLDREVVGSADVQLLECKTTGLNGMRLWAEGVPEYVQLQVMHQLAVTGKQAADVAVLVCGQELRIYRIERDDALIAKLILLEEEFWRLVETDTQPPADGTDSADRALRALYPHDNADVMDCSADLELSGVFADLLTTRALLKQHQERETQLKQRLQESMGDAAELLFDQGSVSWRRSKDSYGFDAERFLDEYPDVAKTFLASKPGSRRFLVHEDDSLG